MNIVFSVDILGYIAAFCTTSSFLPQVMLIIRTKDTDSLSLGMYSLLVLGIILWIFYGYYKKDSVLIWANSVSLLFASIILSFKIKNMIAAKLRRAKNKK